MRTLARLRTTYIFGCSSTYKIACSLTDGVLVRVAHDQEALGLGTIAGVGPLSPDSVNDRVFEVEIPIAPAALAHIDENLRGAQVDLTLQLYGHFFVHVDEEPQDGAPSFPGNGWSSVSLQAGGTSDLRIQIARSDWYTRVLQPLGAEEYVPIEIRLPVGELHSDSDAAVSHIREAERTYALGDDPATFGRCRAALDAMPGAKKQIYENIADPLKRQRIDELARVFGEYMHSGRHVADSGPDQGTFPVDHRDAAFVLSTTKLLVAYSARLLESLSTDGS